MLDHLQKNIPYIYKYHSYNYIVDSSIEKYISDKTNLKESLAFSFLKTNEILIADEFYVLVRFWFTAQTI
jgi:hypothetical protein